MKWKALLVLAVFLMNGCIVGYRNYPREQLRKPAPERRLQNVTYMVEGTTLSGGYLAIRETFKRESPFENPEERPTPPENGLFIKAKVETISPSVGSAIAGYFSYATLTIVPAWSTKDGARVQFTVYQDGKILKTFDYETRRFIGIWLGFLPFIWANALTANEEQVFTAITKQFFEDAKPILN